MECPVCKQCHPKQFDAFLLWVKMFSCKKCGVLFRPLTREDLRLWRELLHGDDGD